MNESNNIVGIEKLEKNNYQPWKFCMRNYLIGKSLSSIGKSLWGFVTSEEKEPELPTQNALE